MQRPMGSHSEGVAKPSLSPRAPSSMTYGCHIGRGSLRSLPGLGRVGLEMSLGIGVGMRAGGERREEEERGGERRGEGRQGRAQSGLVGCGGEGFKQTGAWRWEGHHSHLYFIIRGVPRRPHCPQIILSVTTNRCFFLACADQTWWLWGSKLSRLVASVLMLKGTNGPG